MDEIVIDWLAPDGTGCAKSGRVTVHVPGALPGERVQISPGVIRRRRMDAILEAVLEPSPDRIVPTCPVQKTCGGCDLAVLAPESRSALLQAQASRLFGRSAHWVPSPRPTGHRARLTLTSRDGALGYLGARSDTFVPIETCGIARDEIAQTLGALQAPDGRIELRSDGSRVVANFLGKGVPTGLPDIAVNGRAVMGDPTLWLQVSGLSLRASPRSFYQVNLEGNERLVAHVRGLVRDMAPERVLDLYSGIGNLGLPVAAAGFPVTAVEREGQATEDLRVSAQKAGLDIDVVTTDARRFDPRTVAFDVAVLDPPRAGAGEVLSRVLDNRPRAVILVSCHPLSGVRDLRIAQERGYSLEDLTCFDFFPDTHHYESVLFLSR